MKNQRMLFILLGIIGLVIVLGGQLFLSGQPQVKVNSSTPQALVTLSDISPVPTQITSKTQRQGDVIVTVDFGDGKILNDTVYAQNALQALEGILSYYKLTFSTKDYKYGRLVERIGEKSNSSTYFWSYKVNGKAGQVASDKYIVHPNDTIQWTYEKMVK